MNEILSNSYFGVHLTIDGYGGDPAKLNDKDLAYFCLDELPGKIGMNKLIKPVVIIAPPVNEKDGGGITGFVVINTSHISFHTFPKRRFVSIDVYTCKTEMDENLVINYFKDAFSLQEVEINIIKRGTKFPSQDLA